MKIEELAKKLALWHTPTFRPIMSHEDLEPILYSVGFISLPAYDPPDPPSFQHKAPSADVQWKEYDFPSAAAAAAAVSGYLPARPRLPFPMIYGLHLIAYRAFLSALECYIDPDDVYNLFHVRAMPICPLLDEDFEKNYRPIKHFGINDGRLYVFRKGTLFHCMLEQITVMNSRAKIHEEEKEDPRIKGTGRLTDPIIMVSLDDLLPESYITSPCSLFGSKEK